MNLNTVSKIGLVVVAAGLSWIIGSEGADWPGTLLVAGGVALAFGPDLVATIGSRRRGRRWLAERVEGWEASIVHVEDVHHLLLRLTPPPDEAEDSSIGCVVRMPDGTEAEALEFVWHPPGSYVSPGESPAREQSNVIPPQRVKVGEKCNDYYYVMFPDSFRVFGGNIHLGRLDAGRYIVTWSRDHGFGRQTLRRCTFAIDSNGLFAEE
jgi:hypothetical protein